MKSKKQPKNPQFEYENKKNICVRHGGTQLQSSCPWVQGQPRLHIEALSQEKMEGKEADAGTKNWMKGTNFWNYRCVHFFISKQMYFVKDNGKSYFRTLEGWRGGSAARSRGCSSRGPESNLQHRHEAHSHVQFQLQGSKALFWSPEVPSTHVISRHTCQQNRYTHQIVILRNFSELKKQKVKTLIPNGEVCESFFPTHQKPTLLRTQKDKSSFPVSAQEVCTA